MADRFKFDHPLIALLDDSCISFHINRNEDNRLPNPRQTTLIPGSEARHLVVPGLNNSEQGLTEELKKIQNWKNVVAYSYKLNAHLFSFLWRFNLKTSLLQHQPFKLVPCDVKTAKLIRKSLKNYMNALSNSIAAGQIMLIPDSEVTFNQPLREAKPYARRVLIVKVQSGNVTIIPFTTKTGSINKAKDILFDLKAQGHLRHNARPAVENFPNLLFRHPSVLKVSCAQPMSTETLLGCAIARLGTVRREVLAFAIEKMKML
ncbi:uncharacterized protein Dvar_51750 [Desulfosarcina variabilis str. Montpellier]|uniref:hypothetical protein n=1 Tax=Desulfosarcina variabilis TaxID=2300 RepID=UPI003AFB3D2B